MASRKRKKLRTVWSDQPAGPLPDTEGQSKPAPASAYRETKDLSQEQTDKSPGSALDNISAVKKKSRRFEKRFPAYTFRKVPKLLDQRVAEIAADLSLLKDDVAQAFLEYALHLYEQEEIKIEPHFAQDARSRRTLYPANRPGGNWGQRSGWHVKKDNPTPPEKKTPRKGKDNAKRERPWKSVVGYRIPRELKERITEIAKTERHEKTATITQGDVVTKLLERAEKDYMKGILVLTPVNL